MALSYVQKLGDGTTRNFDFTFDYLSRKHVALSVDGVLVPFTWVGTYSVLAATAPAVDTVVEIRRTTPREERLVNFTDGSTLVATDLNTSSLQAFFLSQEAFDQGAASLAVTEDGQYSAQTRRVSNLGDPILPEDAVNKQWAETAMSSQLTQATSARNGSVTAKNASEAAAQVAATNRIASETARQGSEAARDSASGHRLNAQNAENAAKSARDVAVAAKDTAVAASDTSVAAKDVAVIKAAEAAASALSVNPANLLKIDQNLGDITDKPAARSNLGLGSLATRNITVSTSEPSGGSDGDIWVQV
jgi:hypothetical protein